MLRSVHHMDDEMLPCSHDGSVLQTSSMSMPRMRADRSREGAAVLEEEGMPRSTRYPTPPMLRGVASRGNSFATHYRMGSARAGTIPHNNDNTRNNNRPATQRMQRSHTWNGSHQVDEPPMMSHDVAASRHREVGGEEKENGWSAGRVGAEHSGSAASASATLSRHSLHTPMTRAVGRGDSSLSSPRRSPAQRDSLCAIETQIRAELDELQLKFRHIAARAQEEDVSQDIITAALDRTSTLIEQKQAQLRLMREARRELASVSPSDVRREDVAHSREEDTRGERVVKPTHPRSDHYELDKSTQRSLLMNELRSMMTESKDKV